MNKIIITNSGLPNQVELQHKIKVEEYRWLVDFSSRNEWTLQSETVDVVGTERKEKSVFTNESGAILTIEFITEEQNEIHNSSDTA